MFERSCWLSCGKYWTWDAIWTGSQGHLNYSRGDGKREEEMGFQKDVKCRIRFSFKFSTTAVPHPAFQLYQTSHLERSLRYQCPPAPTTHRACRLSCHCDQKVSCVFTTSVCFVPLATRTGKLHMKSGDTVHFVIFLEFLEGWWDHPKGHYGRCKAFLPHLFSPHLILSRPSCPPSIQHMRSSLSCFPRLTRRHFSCCSYPCKVV